MSLLSPNLTMEPKILRPQSFVRKTLTYLPIKFFRANSLQVNAPGSFWIGQYILASSILITSSFLALILKIYPYIISSTTATKLFFVYTKLKISNGFANIPLCAALAYCYFFLNSANWRGFIYMIFFKATVPQP